MFSKNIILNVPTYTIRKLLKRHFIKRRYPIDRDEENKLPTFKYPTADPGDRRVYSWGLAETGALGLQVPKTSAKYGRKNMKMTSYPTRVTFAEQFDVSDIACGYGFSVFAVKKIDNYKIFGTGLNTDSQIGYHDPRKEHPLEILKAPAPIYIKLKSQNTKVKGLSAGRAHLLVLTDNEGVYALGNNSYGQCGRKIIDSEDYQNSSYVHNIKRVNGETVAQVHCGQDHSMFITESGKVFTCGYGADGQLGNNSLETSSKISQVVGDVVEERIVKLSCSSDCVLALNDKGEVFGWGNSEYSQLNGDVDVVPQVSISRHLSFLSKFGKIVDIASAGSHCTIVNDKGEVFSWGYGTLGVGPEVQHSKTPIQIPPILFSNVFHDPVKIEKLASGLFHTAAINSKGELFMWGINKHGCLGLGHKNNQYFPLRSSVGAQVIKVSCGPDHTLALCKPFV